MSSGEDQNLGTAEPKAIPNDAEAAEQPVALALRHRVCVGCDVEGPDEGVAAESLSRCIQSVPRQQIVQTSAYALTILLLPRLLRQWLQFIV